MTTHKPEQLAVCVGSAMATACVWILIPLAELAATAVRGATAATAAREVPVGCHREVPADKVA